MQAYSAFFKTLHDETTPTGHLGQGTHYSVLRAVVFHDPRGRPLPEGQLADFAVIWDKDHDARVMEPIEEIYRRGLLPSFVMFGERKGCFTGIVSNKAVIKKQDLAFNPAFLLRVDGLELSIRSYNCLRNEGIKYIADLVQKTENEMLRMPNAGRKTLHEIKEVLGQMGLQLGMEIPGWPPENIEELIKNVARDQFLETEVNTICQSLTDPWTAKVVTLDAPQNPIIPDDADKVSLYLKNLEMLWRLGIVPAQQQKPATSTSQDGQHKVPAPQPTFDPTREYDRRWTEDPSEVDDLRRGRI